jgi:hypothetical protein
MKCDFCEKEMDRDETGIMLLEHKMGGHMLCAMRFSEALKEAMKKAAHHQRLSGREILGDDELRESWANRRREFTPQGDIDEH